MRVGPYRSPSSKRVHEPFHGVSTVVNHVDHINQGLVYISPENINLVLRTVKRVYEPSDWCNDSINVTVRGTMRNGFPTKGTR